MEVFPKIKRMGEGAILVEFEPEITPEILAKVLKLKKFLQKKLAKQKVEVTNTYNSLLIYYVSSIENAYNEIHGLFEEFSGANIEEIIESKLFHIPVCYSDVFALDLDEISRVKKLAKEEIIRLHSSVDYLVYFTGFLPGFLYLGGLPQVLHFSRRDHPRPQVQKGAVGIGEKQTGIYPQTSPGGWNIIGNSPVKLFDLAADKPCPISAGDRLRFYQVDLEEHQRISELVERGEFRIKSEKL
ncbi:5-oxoprolinase subunit PxpB [Salinimicrobium sp. MT39]|uniref:5-oxoprolinase subunit PxpB n=1 Tax=Salinimicrobium profundisediminis TaxID=2994553 RepID=A0A9X3I268_9FLAO|nr:5-oxoprolinase subunit PxpB [Salinimicrobium profundisediminis]MCX2839706.1 5-oxoprolinase subunit PxpB [Salinimicrobium profundisediminis]